MIPEVLEEFMRANIAGRPKTPQTANRPSKNRGRYYDSDSDVPHERYELSSDDDELYAPAPVKRSKQHADDRRQGPNTQASAREQNAKRSSHPKGAYSPSQRNQGQRQRSPSEPVELIRDWNGFDGNDRDEEGYNIWWIVAMIRHFSPPMWVPPSPMTSPSW
jgi:hypothetical protein